MALPAAVAALLVVSLLAYGVARLYGAAVHGTENALSRLRRSLVVACVVSALLGLLAFVGAGGLDPIERVLGEGYVGDAVGVVAMDAAVYVAVLACYLGFWPAIRAARDLEATTAHAAVRFGRALAAVLGPMAVVIYAFFHMPGGPGYYLVVLALLALGYAGNGYIVRLAQSTREPTDAERERIAAACDTADFAPRSVRVIESEENEWPGLAVRGPPRYRSLFVGSYLLSAYDDDALTVQVARGAGQARRGYLEAKVGALVAFVVALGTLVTASNAVGLAVGALGLVVAVAILWYGNRARYAADRDAAAATSTETVVEFLRALAEDYGLSLDAGGRIRNFLKMRPNLRRRINRLEERAD
ncbi:hypothetical protein [Halarchaeum sp. P4]|uniref:hypothetical protein n=1 Tax=Halarchaeum sp. P4 TaxID=3421639 RepID=UPI003EBB54FE